MTAELETLFTAADLGTLVTLKRDGRPQISNVNYTYDAAERQFRISVTDGRAKTANIRRDPRVSFYVAAEGGWDFAVAEGRAELSAVAASADDETVAELVEVYRAIRGEHPDWDEYRQAMVADRRLVLRIAVERVYGKA